MFRFWEIIFIVNMGFLTPMQGFSTVLIPCSNLLLSEAELHAKRETTQDLIAYLNQLAARGAIDDEGLVEFIDGLEKAKVNIPISQRKAELSSGLLIHRQNIQNFTAGYHGKLDLEKLATWARNELSRRGLVSKNRTQAKQETKNIYHKIEFLAIPPGEFEMLKSDGRRHGNLRAQVTLTHAIEVMSAPVTQNQWLEVMGDNPSYFTEGVGSLVAEVRGKRFKINPDHPVENITWWSAIVFANKLSEKYGLRPAYDLSRTSSFRREKMRFVDVSLDKSKRRVLRNSEEIIRVAAQGNLGALREGDSPGIRLDSSPSPLLDDDVYEAEGFRLPTEAEQAYVRALAMPENGIMVVRSEMYDWNNANSKRRTHPVALLQPFVVGDKKIFDLHGNVREWNHDWYAEEIDERPNPLGSRRGPGPLYHRSMTMGSWFEDLLSIRRDTHGAKGHPCMGYNFCGVRLVRTLGR